MEQLILGLLTWIGMHSAYDVSSLKYNKDFKVKVVSQQTLQELHFLEGVAPQDVGAVYEPYRNTVYLSDQFNGQDEYEVSLLAHELVHVLQHREDPITNPERRKTAEAEAYRLQARYLKSKGLVMEGLLTDIMGMYQSTESTY